MALVERYPKDLQEFLNQFKKMKRIAETTYLN